ncbi:glycosyltransferase [Rhodopseudomonas sp. P1]|uniref:glycosyltransferase n=1 Tax=Rhodopseudomonas sp. P1 TaxID=3434357 RepID=UPI0031FD5D37
MVGTDHAGLHETMSDGRGDGEAIAPWPGPPRFLAARPALVSNDNYPDEQWRGATDRQSEAIAAPELDCLRGVLSPALLQAAARRARDLDIGADRVLIQQGLIEEEAYLRYLARWLRLSFEDFGAFGRADCPLEDTQISSATATGIVPLRVDGELIWVVAPRHLASHRLCRLLDDHPDTRSRLRLASTANLETFLARQGERALASIASADLHQRHPMLSAAPRKAGPVWRQRLKRGACVAVLLALPFFPDPDVTTTLLAAWFIGFAGLRLLACLWPRPTLPTPPRKPDAELPIYTVVAALYREADSVGTLVEALDALDYPREKLDLILVIELDDLATRAALARIKRRPHLRVLIAPAVEPRTKPKALNYALAFARGSFIAVYDAEDRPDPDQLRAALAAFDAASPNTACVQASLCIDNLTHSWLSRTFLAEYAGQFDLFLPGLAALGLPLPLGGTSNHFRTDVLRAIGGWDPHNVTEDADLGFRLARFGHRCVTIASATYEEAPIAFGNWLPQRARWMKGWIQTWEVHMRQPIRLWREIGWRGVIGLNLVVGGNVLSALAYPLLVWLAVAAAIDWPEQLSVWLGGWLEPAAPSALHWLTIASGIASTLVVGLLGLARRRQLRHAGALALTPLYWLCLSVAAWRALAQFVWCPYRWDKTQHGVARRPHPLAPQPKARRSRWRLSA